jgi:hypothetical protein
MRSAKNLFLVTCLLSLITCRLSLAASSVTIEARAIPDRVTIGDSIRLYVQIERPKKVSIVPLDPKLNLAPFEIKKIETPPYARGMNRVRETFIVTLTVFELGDLKIPPLEIHTRDGSGRPGKVLTQPVPVKVVSVGKKKNDTDKIRPIKGPASLSLLGIESAAAGILAALLAIFLIIKIIIRIRKVTVDPETLKAPHERALLELERLKKKGYLSEGKVKEHYSELSDILRRYLERRFGIEALERTYFEIVGTLKEKDFEPALIKEIDGVLQSADLVKFAKYAPPRTLADELEAAIRRLVDRTKPEVKRQVPPGNQTERS